MYPDGLHGAGRSDGLNHGHGSHHVHEEVPVELLEASENHFQVREAINSVSKERFFSFYENCIGII